jgi:hypothetical protein
MSGSGDNEQGAAKLPRVESVIADGPPDLAEHYRAFGVAADSFERFLSMIEVRLRTGNRLLFAYHSLARAEWNPSSGITLLFPDVAVELRGRNLGDLFSAIREQRAAWVCEADRPTEELTPPAAAVIEFIVIEPCDLTRSSVRTG